MFFYKINLFIEFIYIYINRIKGDVNSYLHIAANLNQDIKNIRVNMLWDLRRNYLMLLEGLPLETGRDNILNYLFDAGILREVSAFTG